MTEQAVKDSWKFNIDRRRRELEVIHLYDEIDVIIQEFILTKLIEFFQSLDVLISIVSISERNNAGLIYPLR